MAQVNTDSSIVSNNGFDLTGKNGGQKKIVKFAKKLAKSIWFVLEWCLVKAGSKSCHYIFCRHYNSCLFHTDPALASYRFALAGERQPKLT